MILEVPNVFGREFDYSQQYSILHLRNGIAK